MTKRKVGTKLVSLMTAAMMMVSTGVLASADEPSFIIKGNYRSGDFWLTSEGKIFEKDDLLPGEIWTSDIKLENTGSRSMLVSLLEIKNNLENDPAVYESLELEITDGENVLYTGPYPGEDDTKEIFEEYMVPGGQDITLQATISMPGEIGNEYQGKELDSTWVFEAKYPEPSHDYDDDDDDDDDGIKKPIKPANPGKNPTGTGALFVNSNTAPALYLFAVLTASATLFILSRKKHLDKTNKKGE